jgi:hypothetical protein
VRCLSMVDMRCRSCAVLKMCSCDCVQVAPTESLSLVVHMPAMSHIPRMPTRTALLGIPILLFVTRFLRAHMFFCLLQCQGFQCFSQPFGGFLLVDDDFFRHIV